MIPKYIPDECSCEAPKELRGLLVERFGSLMRASLYFGLSDDYFGNVSRTNRTTIGIIRRISKVTKRDFEIDFVIMPRNKKIKTEIDFKNKYCVRVVGNILGDGCIDKTFTVRYHNTSVSSLDYFDSCMEKIFGTGYSTKRLNNSSRSKQDAIETRYSNVCGKILINFFGKFAFSNEEKHIPEVIFTWPDNLRAIVLAALIDDEGSIGAKRISINQVSKKLTDDMVILLESFGIRSTIYKKYHEKYRTGYLNRIEIFGKKNILKTIYLIENELRNERKMLKLEELKRKYANMKYKRQKGELESEVFDFLDKNKIGTIKKIAEKINVNNEEIRKMIHKLHDKNLIKLNKIKKTYFIERLK